MCHNKVCEDITFHKLACRMVLVVYLDFAYKIKEVHKISPFFVHCMSYHRMGHTVAFRCSSPSCKYWKSEHELRSCPCKYEYEHARNLKDEWRKRGLPKDANERGFMSGEEVQNKAVGTITKPTHLFNGRRYLND